MDIRSLCVIREALAYASGLCDVMFSIQCLGAGPISLFGSEEQRARWLPQVARGEAVAAFALTEPRSGSDPSLIETTARRDNSHYVLNGVKRFISNAGLAHFYVVFARVTPDPDTKDSLSAFIVPADNASACASTGERLELIAPHPIGEIGLEGCRGLAQRASARRAKAW